MVGYHAMYKTVPGGFMFSRWVRNADWRPRQFHTETCYVLNNGARCNWDFFDMLHKLGFIGR